MAHSRSALKRWRQSLERRTRNRSVKSKTRTVLTQALVAIDSDASAAEAAVRSAISSLDKAAQKGVIHANAASRSKARLLKRYNLATANAVAAAAAGAATAAAEPEVKAKPAAKRAAPKTTAARKPSAKAEKPAAKPAPKPRTRKT